MLCKKSLEFFCKSAYSVCKEPLRRFLLEWYFQLQGKFVSWNMPRAVCVNLLLSSGIVFSYLVVILSLSYYILRIHQSVLEIWAWIKWVVNVAKWVVLVHCSCALHPLSWGPCSYLTVASTVFMWGKVQSSPVSWWILLQGKIVICHTI